MTLYGYFTYAPVPTVTWTLTSEPDVGEGVEVPPTDVEYPPDDDGTTVVDDTTPGGG